MNLEETVLNIASQRLDSGIDCMPFVGTSHENHQTKATQEDRGLDFCGQIQASVSQLVIESSPHAPLAIENLRHDDHSELRPR